MKIPDSVKDAMSYYCDNFAGSIKYLGKYQDCKVFGYDFLDQDLCIGLPFVCLLEPNGNAVIVDDFIATNVIDQLR